MNTHKPDVRRLDFDQWNQERFGMMCTDAENFAHWKEVIQKLCKAYGKCTLEERNLIIKLNNKIIRHKNEYKRERANIAITEPMICR